MDLHHNVFYFCPMALHTWEVWGKELKGFMCSAGSCQDVIGNILNAQKWFEGEEVAEFLIILWELCTARKKLLFEAKAQTPSELVEVAKKWELNIG